MKNVKNDFLKSSTRASLDEKKFYIPPFFSVCCVELENACMVVVSGATSSGTPEVTDWEDSSSSGDIWLNN